MLIQFANRKLSRLEEDPEYTAGFPGNVVRAFRNRMQYIRSAVDERDFYAMQSLHFEKLKGKRRHQYSMRLNKQWRLVLELKRGDTGKVVIVVGIEDYHR